MNENRLRILECCETKDFNHFAKDASLLSCGHLICKECLPTNDNDIINCGQCGKTNQAKLESLKITQEPFIYTYQFNENIKNIFKETGERLKEEINHFKHVNSEEYINFRFDFMKEEIDLRVESLKCELDSLREKLFGQVDALKNEISLKLYDTKNNTTDKLKDYEKYLDDFQKKNFNSQKETKEIIFKCQETIRNLTIEIKEFLNTKFQVAFLPSILKLDIGIIGKVNTPESILNSSILNGEQANDLIKLCEFPEDYRYSLLYRASRDGFKASDFHRLCDNRSKTLVIIKSQNNYIFGGYTSQTWDGIAGYKSYVDEFLFSLTNPSNKSIKININYSFTSYAIYCQATHGPTFGHGFDLHVCSDSNIYKNSYSSLGNTFIGPTTYFTYAGGKNKKFLISEIEVFNINKL